MEPEVEISARMTAVWMTRAVQGDGQVVADVVSRVLGESGAGLVLDLKLNLGIADLVKADLGAGEIGAGDDQIHSGVAGDGKGTFFQRNETRAQKFEPAGLLEKADGFVRIADARELDDDAVVALELDYGLGDAQGVYPDSR